MNLEYEEKQIKFDLRYTRRWNKYKTDNKTEGN
jgi:hypothetical protein